MINRRFKDYFDKNKLNEEEYDELINLKQDIFKALDAKDLNEANSTNKKIEKIIQKVLLTHLMLKLTHWNIKNEKEKKQTSF